MIISAASANVIIITTGVLFVFFVAGLGWLAWGIIKES